MPSRETARVESLAALLQLELAANRWWDTLTRAEQEDYVHAHPHTHMRVNRLGRARSVRPETTVPPEQWDLSEEDEETLRAITLKQVPTHAEMIKTVDGIRTRLGIPRSSIKFSNKLKTFKVDGREMYYAGAATLSTGKIVLYRNRLTRQSIVGITVHECYHVRYERFLRQFEVDAESVARGGKPTPVYQALMDTLGNAENFKLMTYVDGVSEYSKLYWSAYHKNDPATVPSKKLVVHETIAEMGRLAYQGYGIRHAEWMGPLPRKHHSPEYPNGFATTEGVDKKLEEGARLWRILFEAVGAFNDEKFKARKPRSSTSTPS